MMQYIQNMTRKGTNIFIGLKAIFCAKELTKREKCVKILHIIIHKCREGQNRRKEGKKRSEGRKKAAERRRG